ncbi:hypothetical protein DH2020_034536 [Rehmannia glutinosa]|uniref:Uncharacterized protein n=1 Tax=Rehmannia glutinosa TaxID=99300 RepID=A0ABR0V927_REHGL
MLQPRKISLNFALLVEVSLVDLEEEVNLFWGNRVVCQICGRNNHTAAKCYKIFDLNFTSLENTSANSYPRSNPAPSQAHLTTVLPPGIQTSQSYSYPGASSYAHSYTGSSNQSVLASPSATDFHTAAISIPSVASSFTTLLVLESPLVEILSHSLELHNFLRCHGCFRVEFPVLAARVIIGGRQPLPAAFRHLQPPHFTHYTCPSFLDHLQEAAKMASNAKFISPAMRQTWRHFNEMYSAASILAQHYSDHLQ